LELSDATTASTGFVGNTFKYNSSLIGSNVISIRRIQDDGSVTSANINLCGGATFNDNTFEENIGCARTHGAIHIVCEPTSANLSSTNYKTYEGIDYSVLFDKKAAYESPTTDANKFSSYATADASAIGGTGTSDSGSVSTKQQVVEFSGNSFKSNYAGRDSSIIQIEGFATVTFSADSLMANGNYVSNLFITNSPIFKGGDSLPAARTTIETLDFEDRALAPITIISAIDVEILGASFQSNWVADLYGSS
jgi:hypothetical protein